MAPKDSTVSLTFPDGNAREFPAGSTILVTVAEDDPDTLAFEAVETPDKPPVELAENQ